jgi:FkbM family methyltransferase
MTGLYLKHLLLRTPLERPALRLRYFAGGIRRLRHPELSELFLESHWIEQLESRVIEVDSNCIDVGCHIGSSLSSIIRHARRGTHLAIEPVPEKASWIKRKFPEVDVRAIALGEKQGQIAFFRNDSQPGFSGFGTPREDRDKAVQIHVNCEKLDDIVRTDLRYAYVKLDVEGAELLVLQGSRNLIARDRPIILFESSHDGASNLGLKREDLFSLLADDCGYDVFLIKDYLEGRPALNLTAFQKAAEYPFRAFNFVGVPGELYRKSGPRERTE